MHSLVQTYNALGALSAHRPRRAHDRVQVSTEVLGRVLAAEIRASTAVPAHDLSTMDGYALDSSGILALPIVGTAGPGDAIQQLQRGTAMRILTGAPLPIGADTVMMQEHATVADSVVTFARPVKAGQFIRKAGEDLQPGDLVLAANTRIGPAEFGLLLSLAIPTVEVFAAPRVVLIPTGSEIGVTVPESVGAPLMHVFESAGANVTLHLPVPDDQVMLRSVLDAAIGAYDMVITIGGASVGDRDLLLPTFRDLGVDFSIVHVAVKPGKPVCIGAKGTTHVIMLPGNPVSSLLTGAFFAAPLIRALSGRGFSEPERLPAVLAEDLHHSPGRAEWMRALYHSDGHALQVRAAKNQGSAALSVTATSNCVVHVAPDVTTLNAGTTVQITTYAALFGASC
jgi:molybdopterin molybdotransferase